MYDYIRARLSAGALAVPKTEILGAVVPPGHPEYLDRPAYKYGLNRLSVRGIINAIADARGETHYFIGPYHTPEIREAVMKFVSGPERS